MLVRPLASANMCGPTGYRNTSAQSRYIKGTEKEIFLRQEVHFSRMHGLRFLSEAQWEIIIFVLIFLFSFFIFSCFFSIISYSIATIADYRAQEKPNGKNKNKKKHSRDFLAKEEKEINNKIIFLKIEPFVVYLSKKNCFSSKSWKDGRNQGFSKFLLTYPL